ncbi:SAM-dependent methyltransferase [Actinoplanes sp. NPDC051513]|uniref:SAM-dependent methyltransferase n=1 Tax=Actinoplanes sp. NPDC051513 TaxID=3363908 RepID=UPI0037AEC4D3
MELNTDVPHSARIYDYLLGGKDHFAADRNAAAAITADWPHLAISMRANRNYMARQARFIAAELGIRQFLDIGAGLPTAPNLHEVVQQVEPSSRVMYVDNDPIVLVHARALLTSAPEGQTTYLDANLRDPAAILESSEFRGTFDLSQPVALSLIAILQFIVDDDMAHRIVDTLMAPLPPGSVLAMSTVTADSAPDEVNRGVAAYVAKGIEEKARDLAECQELFRGLDLIDPGVVLVNHWRPDDAARAVPDEHVHMYGGVAVKR